MIKAGFVGEAQPRVVIPNVVGRPRKGVGTHVMMDYGMKDIYIAEEINSLRRMLDV